MKNIMVPLPKTKVAELAWWNGEGQKRCQFCIPLTPVKNVWLRLHWTARQRYGKRLVEYINIYRHHLGIKRRPWADKLLVSAVRCSKATRAADTDGVIVGLEKAIDALVTCGFVQDDSPEFLQLGKIEDRPRGHWGDLAGPGTWLRLQRNN